MEARKHNVEEKRVSMEQGIEKHRLETQKHNVEERE